MPASPTSLKVTEAFRARVLATRLRLGREATRRWPTIDHFDGTDWPQRMAVVVAQGQTEAVRATAGYLAAFLSSELGHRTRGPVLDSRAYSGVSRDGRPLSEALESPLIGVKAALKEGKSPQEALAYGLNRATRMVGIDFDYAHRTALLEAIDRDERFDGWQRAVRGTCGACAGKATGLSHGLSFQVHPGCQCVSEPTLDVPKTRYKAQQTSRWMEQRGRDYRLTAEQRDTAQRWQGFDSETPNRFLRAGKPLYEHDREFVEQMDSLLDSAGPVGHNAQTFRAVPADALEKAGVDIESLAGKVYTDPGFAATTPLREQTATWGHGDLFSENKARTLWDLTVHKDVKAVWEEAATGEDWGLQEMVLQRDCRFVVKNAVKDKEGNWLIKAAVLPPK